MNQDYISIKEFASRVNVSTQAIYQRIDKDLSSYLKVIDNKKMLNVEGLKLFDKTEVAKDIDKILIKTLQDNLTLLNNQLVAKDSQLLAKDSQIKELLERNKELNFLLARQQEQPQITEVVANDEMITVKKRWYHKFLKL